MKPTNDPHSTKKKKLKKKKRKKENYTEGGKGHQNKRLTSHSPCDLQPISNLVDAGYFKDTW